MQPPKRWSDIVVGLACGYTRQEIAAGLDTSAQSVSTSVQDIQSTMDGYDDPAAFLSELLDADIQSNIDLDAVEEFREQKEEEDNDED